MMLLLGAISLLASISYNSSILAFIGLGLVFWGAILLYIRPEEYTRKIVLEALLSPSLTALCQMIKELRYEGDVTYLPPKYFANPETSMVYVAKRKLGGLPTSEETRPHENQAMARTRQGMLVTPPGLGLSKLLEKSFGRSFIKTDLQDLQQNLPKLFIENLEIVENLELLVENDMTQRKEDDSASTIGTSVGARGARVHAKMTKPIGGTLFKEAEEHSQIAGSIGCPVCSAIAVAISKATVKPVRISETKRSEDSNTLEITYEILEE
jgi:hypothetical protein